MTTVDQIGPLVASINTITKSLIKKKSSIGGDNDGVDFRSQINAQIEEGKSKIQNIKEFLAKPNHDRNDRAKITKITGQFKQVSSEFEKEASEIIGLQLANAIGTGGRSNSLSMNGRDRGSFSERIRFKGDNSYAQQDYSFGEGAQQQTINFRHLEVTLDNPHETEEIIIQEYNTEVKSLVKDLEAIREITNDLHMLTVEQGEQLKVAVTNTEVAAMDVEQGVAELGDAYVYKKKYRKKVIVIVFLSIIVIGLIVGLSVGLKKR
ncbi:hypothetical protein PPL_05790 [Heterostelium album PN500]|uniref:t-SNARE coiled-coil homology domain-containing protein n=1 Tax=Heterostelium pallidum (strain ATCC 26659 / Pp 5 / PN500) TaxID=670386 RepID=D3BB58_HETP5|nr:hypothetical protein PPL_05790 [Heterostelium album PN500]EFA81795.1 hypothetical protein PPL_05790 [Heterostelium album PN500]|eukprot:XP_020433912.1 hypothetical protein PPL_05790 [Heterostelium album PN500]